MTLSSVSYLHAENQRTGSEKMISGMSSSPVSRWEPLPVLQFYTENLNVFHRLFFVIKKELVNSFPVSAETMRSILIHVTIMLK